jgi:hypothetical protein
MRPLMNVAPPARCLRQVRDAPLLRARHESIAGAIALRGRILPAAENVDRQDNPFPEFDFDFVFALNREVLNLLRGLEAFGFEPDCGNLCGNQGLLFFLVILLLMNYLSRPHPLEFAPDIAHLLLGFA